MKTEDITFADARKCLKQLLMDNKHQYDEETIKALEKAISTLTWAETDYYLVKELSKGIKR